MRRPVVLQVAALTKRCQVSWVVVAGILVEMGRSEHDKGRGQGRGGEASQRRLPRSKLGQFGQRPRLPAAVVAPALFVGVPPQALRSDDNVTSVWSPAVLATTPGAIEADNLRQLSPVDRVEPTLAGADRHDDSMSHLAEEQKG